LGLKLNGTLQLLVCDVDVSLLGDKTVTAKKTERLIDTSYEVILEENAGKTNARKVHYMRIGMRRIEKLAHI
jgi:hypothetical protein